MKNTCIAIRSKNTNNLNDWDKNGQNNEKRLRKTQLHKTWISPVVYSKTYHII